MVCISEVFWIYLVWAEPANLSEINWIQEFDIWTRLPHSVARSCCVEVMKENCQKLRILWREGSSCSLASATYFATNNIWGYEILNSAELLLKQNLQQFFKYFVIKSSQAFYTLSLKSDREYFIETNSLIFWNDI